ncbi:hypothetical protein KGA65_09100 [Ideonella sp. B7]|uniref:hypothetical protein n=1 Tax=Ideonella benzenivorans TaxID=2831643 RepID=UPI001CECC71D|nr:hypothetical protein [Ideonella benzenivorans]MCA6216692.1 hypothetical protein [Ideonella benzenivorans]
MTTELQGALDALREADQRLAAINEEMARLNAEAANAGAVTGRASAIKAERRGLIARLIRAGQRVTGAEPEVLALSEQLTDLAPRESGAAVVSEAVQEMLVELQAEAAAIHAQRPGLIGQVRLARFAEAGEEIEALKPQVETLLEQLGEAYARLCGAGMAHQQLARQLREQHGASVQPLGAEFQTRQISLPVAGFSYTTASAYNLLLSDVGAAMDAAKAEFLFKWSQA